MTEYLTDKTIVVTGAGSGIGWGIVNSCVEAGARVVMAEINPAHEARAKELQAQGFDVHFYQVDVSSKDSIDSLIETLGEQFDRIDGLVNNAGVTIEGEFLDFAPEQLEALWTTNLRSVFLMCQGIGRIMKNQGAGAIVNISSNHSVASVPGYEMYAATKAGISAMTRAMCWSLGRSGIRVNTLCPGLTETEAIAALVNTTPGLRETFESMHATGSYSTTKQIGDAAVFLLSDASQAMTGTSIMADHGLAAGLCKLEDLVPEETP